MQDLNISGSGNMNKSLYPHVCARHCMPRPRFTALVNEQSACSHQLYSHWQLVLHQLQPVCSDDLTLTLFSVQNGYAFLFNIVLCLLLYCHILLLHMILWALTSVHWECCCLIGSSQWIIYTTFTFCVTYSWKLHRCTYLLCLSDVETIKNRF